MTRSWHIERSYHRRVSVVDGPDTTLLAVVPEVELSELRTVTEEKIHLALAELSGVMPEDEHERDCHRAAVRALSDALERLSRV